ncbi:unnamed protein product, partial [Musa hybrid cultivar]
DRVESNAAVITPESTTPTAAGQTDAASSRPNKSRWIRLRFRAASHELVMEAVFLLVACS